ncbi:hypothetical protein [Arthrobacter sp. JUb115]|uniref:hypothetical protein n=1 Tax=Arthrobacter sp. JUb115 TaxID=2485108 RepID=UPI001060D17D|nr:hypothetical protein [Arthrobacter sp. JUb115]TDU27098.1 hypothetical protein EDF61_104174 [Arthrobacter sp. JUb115]
MIVLDGFPDDWRCKVVVTRAGGLDDNGDPQPGQVLSVENCLISTSSSTKDDQASDVVTTKLSLFRDPDPEFEFQSTDKIVVPDNAMGAGTYFVDGRPRVTPLGVEVPLKGAESNG